MACDHWLTSHERMRHGLREEDVLTHHVVIRVSDSDAIFDYLDSDMATGLWYYHSGRGDLDPFQFMFSDANTAFDFKMRFG